LQPHRSETFKLSNDPRLVETVRDIVGLYLDPPAHAAVFCVDEKPQIQALDRTQVRRRTEVRRVPPRDQNPFEQFRQDVLQIDENEIIQRRGVGDDDH
jgi:hypothetical protein